MSVSDNFDANDVAQMIGLDHVRQAFEKRVSTLPPFAPYDEPEKEADTSTFEFLTLTELRQLPPPDWLIHDTIVSDGLSIIYGPPGAGKSFIALDMALRVALDMDWHGTKTRKVGVLYIAGEGVRGLGKRVDGWALKHGIDLSDVPFAAITIAPQMLDPGERSKLIRTLDEIKRKLSFEVGLIIVDTVSRAIAGQDENGQETMSAFVRSCDEIKAHTGGAMIGIHHSGKDIERGMRGSTVLLGGCDAAIRLEKDERQVKITFEKQKDAEEREAIFMDLEPFHWNTGSVDEPGDDFSTLIPVLAEAPKMGTLHRDWIAQAFGIMADAWGDKRPLSNKPQTQRDGRYAPAIFARKIGGEAQTWAEHISVWLENGCLSIEVADKHAKVSGLRVIDAIF